MNYYKFIFSFLFQSNEILSEHEIEILTDPYDLNELEDTSHLIEHIFDIFHLVKWSGEYTSKFNIEYKDFISWYNQENDTDYDEDKQLWEYYDDILKINPKKIKKGNINEYLAFLKQKYREMDKIGDAGPTVLHIYTWEEDVWKIYDIINCSPKELKQLKKFLGLFPNIKWEIGSCNFFDKIENKIENAIDALEGRL